MRDREYPRDGADAYNSLPDNAIVYAEGLPKSPLFRDALYLLGDENAELPPEPEEEQDDSGLDDDDDDEGDEASLGPHAGPLPRSGRGP